MTESSDPGTENAAVPALPSGVATAAEKVALVERWEATKKSLAFALAADDYSASWLDRLCKLGIRIRDLARQDPDVALYLMLQTAVNDVDNYSASHSMYCAVVADLCSSYLEWPEPEADALRCAALTMNLGMLSVQNAMAVQAEPVTSAQKSCIEAHAEKSVELLKSAAVDDPLWLETVRRHHRPVGDGESADPLMPAQRMAQLLQRIDVFTAKLSRRKARPGSSATVAARDACLDKSGLPDATGATMLRVLGLYPPGSFVRLVNGDFAVVVRRGEKAHTPVVAPVRRADGGVVGQAVAVDTRLRENAVQRSLSADEVKIRLDHARIVVARS